MGLGGDVTVLQCHVEHADTHMTLNPVAVNYQCWAARRAAHIAADGVVDYDREACRADGRATPDLSGHRGTGAAGCAPATPCSSTAT